MKNLLKKLEAVKSEIGKISKDSTNPFFKSKYFDINALLEHCEPLLHKNGLVLLQPIKEGCVGSEIHDVDSGEKITSCIPLPVLSDPQKLGSAITYYRRYTLQSLLALQSEDDDGNKASNKDVNGNKASGKTKQEKPKAVKLTDAQIDKAIADGKVAQVIQGIAQGKYIVTDAQNKKLNQ